VKNFWTSLPSPFSVLAPMEEVTDIVFREVVSWCQAPDVFFTEFTSTDGLCSRGQDRVIHRLRHTPSSTPVVAQIWGKNPDKYLEACKLIAEMGFDGIDINLGCPVDKIVKSGCCSALIDNPSLVRELYQAACEGAANIPVSIKTRLGFKTKVTEEWAEFLLSLNLPALTIHGRTAKQLSKVPADWSEIAKVVAARNRAGSETIIIGNGDVSANSEIAAKSKQYGVDGVMIGRGIFDDMHIFSNTKPQDYWRALAMNEKLALLVRHLELHQATWASEKPFSTIKKFAKIYASNFDGASELRCALMECETHDLAIQTVKNFVARTLLSDRENTGIDNNAQLAGYAFA
jgi:tRNA-dihydrouridine synthase